MTPQYFGRVERIGVLSASLDELRRTPEIRVCTAVHVDGPLEGQTTPCAPAELGAQAGYRSHVYELVALPGGDEPGKLRHVSSRARSSS
jgi:hypothetical protein